MLSLQSKGLDAGDLQRFREYQRTSYSVLESVAATLATTLTPNWNDTRQSDCAPQDGLWAIEPHVAAGGVGAKFEDILVIECGRARYLDDDLPHTRRWQHVTNEPNT